MNWLRRLLFGRFERLRLTPDDTMDTVQWDPRPTTVIASSWGCDFGCCPPGGPAAE